MRFLKYVALVGVVVVAAAVAAVTTGGVQLPEEIPLVGSAEASATQVAAVAEGVDEVVAFDAPDGGSEIETFAARTEYGTPVAFGVVADRGNRLEVRLPGRPNGRIGFVDEGLVAVTPVAVSIDVDLAGHKLTVSQDGDTVLDADIAIGSDEYPTPRGEFYVTDELRSEDPAYGDWAFGISAWSDVLTEFNGGSGQIGIHGTDDTSSIGQDVSHGCVRVTNDVAIALAELVEVGTPVTIH
ncbi:MAG: L,D-transpeptidase [Acidimicrobiia bacterium]|nr:L,D-transpeptidase [Acidimicrobiia bacterium]